MAGATNDLQSCPGVAGERAAVAERRDFVVVAVHDEHGTVQASRQLAEHAPLAMHVPTERRGQRLGVAVQRPADPVLNRLGRVRLREDPRDEPLRELVEASRQCHGLKCPHQTGLGLLRTSACLSAHG